jgi:hypothetical protein
MTRCNKKQIKHGRGTIAKYAKRISNKMVRCCKIWTAIRFQVEWIAVWRDFQPRMTRCNKNKNLEAAQQIFRLRVRCGSICAIDAAVESLAAGRRLGVAPGASPMR